MAEWHQSLKGNFTTFDYGHAYTVFRNRDNLWQVAHQEAFSRQMFESVEEAKSAAESHSLGIDVLDFRSPERGWQATKQGGFYRRARDGIDTVKQAKSGSWFATHNGELFEGLWFDSREEAQAYLDRNSCSP